MSKMSTVEFLGLKRVADNTQAVPMVDRLMGGGGNSLFGGAGLAAGLIVLTELSGRTPVWMTSQFVSQVSPPADLVLVAEELARGRSASQGRVTGVSNGTTVLTMLGACGDRTEQHQGIWRRMPESFGPDDSEPVDRHPESESLHDHVEVRMARGMFGFTETGAPTGDATSLLWARMPAVHHDAGAIAIIADYMPSAVGNSLSQRVHCSSLDNTIRFTGPIEPVDNDEWVLCENHIEFVGAGFAHGTGYVWRGDGQLLATSSQTVTVATPRD